ncbi:MAG: MBL fold metallo-hydrolase [Cyclobacteriaceae bacterium]
MKQFGGRVTKQRVEQYSQSPNWKEGKFQNLVKTEMEFHFRDVPKMLKQQFFDKDGREPKEPITVIPFDRTSFFSSRTQIIWYGHSVILLRMNGKTILIDPMLGPDAAPIAPFKSKRFSENTLDLIDQFPQIDLVLMTHDHYDHLDLASIKSLIPKVKQYYVGLGIKRHLTKWGIKDGLITEFDWWDEESIDGIKITYTPSRHFSGRGATDRQKSLWGGWAIKTSEENIYFSGDGGYGEHFKEVGQRLGPFDFGIMECGQYNELWHQIHMYPEESVKAAKEAGVKKAMPVHWAGFALAMHTWKEPVDRFVLEADLKKLNILTPQLGELFNYKSVERHNWWTKLT